MACKCTDCPKDISVFGGSANSDSNTNAPRIGRKAQRRFIRFSVPYVVDPAATTTFGSIWYCGGGPPVRAGILSPYSPNLEITFKTHGQLVYGPFQFTDDSGTFGTCTFVEGLLEGTGEQET